MNILSKTIVTTACLLLFTCSPCLSHAGIVIEFDSATLAPNEGGAIDVFIRSDNGADSVALFDFELAIVNAAGDGIPSFVDPQLSTETQVNRYVFGTESGDFRSAVATRNSLIQSDSHRTFADIALPTDENDRLLLGRIELLHELPASEVANFAGATFEIALIEGARTTFFDSAAAEVPIAPVSFANRGIVTVSAVPEPSSLTLGLGLVSVLLHRRRRKA